jgi:hypothetical protein
MMKVAHGGNDANNRYGWVCSHDVEETVAQDQTLADRYEALNGAPASITMRMLRIGTPRHSGVHGKLDASHVLRTIISDACQHGYRLYDFLPSGGFEGVAHFKSGFSPETRPVRIYMSPLVRLSGSIRAAVRANPAYKLLMRGTGF